MKVFGKEILNSPPLNNSDDVVASKGLFAGATIVVSGMLMAAFTKIDPQVAGIGIGIGGGMITGAYGLAKGDSSNRRQDENIKSIPTPTASTPYPPVFQEPPPPEPNDEPSTIYEARVKPDPPDKPPAIGFDPYKYVAPPTFSSQHRPKT